MRKFEDLKVGDFLYNITHDGILKRYVILKIEEPLYEFRKLFITAKLYDENLERKSEPYLLRIYFDKETDVQYSYNHVIYAEINQYYDDFLSYLNEKIKNTIRINRKI